MIVSEDGYAFQLAAKFLNHWREISKVLSCNVRYRFIMCAGTKILCMALVCRAVGDT